MVCGSVNNWKETEHGGKSGKSVCFARNPGGYLKPHAHPIVDGFPTCESAIQLMYSRRSVGSPSSKKQEDYSRPSDAYRLPSTPESRKAECDERECCRHR